MAKAKQTPMMKQYQAVKDQYPDAFLFYRLGDFYELFNEDAIKGAKILELTLTTRNHSAANPIPMCGVPYRAVDNYIDILIDKGYKVAICEQMAVTRLVTPGTKMDLKGDDAQSNNYLTAVLPQAPGFKLAYADLTTGELKVTSLATEAAVINELINLQTKEVVYDQELPASLTTVLTKQNLLLSHQTPQTGQAEISYLTQALTDDGEIAVVTLLVSYLLTTQKRALAHLQVAQAYELNAYMKIDHNSKANLELMINMRSGKKQGTLAWLLDATKTAMGSRLLKRWLDRPLIDQTKIEERQDKVAVLLDHYFERSNLQAELTKV